MKRILAFVIVLAALAPVGSAAAKGPFIVRICGAPGCTTVKQEFGGRAPDALGSTLLNALGRGHLKAPTVGTPALARYYSLEIEEFGGSGPVYYVPSLRMLRAAPYWFRAPGSFVRRMEAVTAGLRPWPAPRLTQVLVGSRRAADPSAYAVLLGPLPRASVPTDAGKSVRIELSAERASPWTDLPVTYFPGVRTLYRDSQWLRVPDRLAAAAERDTALTAPSRSTSDSGTWPWAVAGGLATLLLAAAAALALRLRRARLA
jgi:hypothetical protein